MFNPQVASVFESAYNDDLEDSCARTSDEEGEARGIAFASSSFRLSFVVCNVFYILDFFTSNFEHLIVDFFCSFLHCRF